MDQQNPTQWRQMFEARRREYPPGPEQAQPFDQPDVGLQARPHGRYDDGYDPAQRPPGGEMPREPLSPDDEIDEAALALALDAQEYRPWVLQRGRGRPAMMLHLRRYESKSGLWMGWQLAYPHLIAAEYVGDRMLSLDFGSRQFVIEGTGLDDLVRHLQLGSVLMVQEFAPAVWPFAGRELEVTAIRSVRSGGDVG